MIASRVAQFVALAAALACLGWLSAGQAQPPREPAPAKSQAAAAPTAAHSKPLAPLEYRRHFIPRDRLAEIVPDDDRYLPMEVAEFQRLVDLAKAAEVGAPSNRARLEQAVFRARLDGDVLIDGTAQLKIAHEGTEPSWLSLEPCSLALAEPRWEGETPTPAWLGVISASTEPAGLGVVSERSGTLAVRWSARGERVAPEMLTFDIDLPRCPTKRLEFDLPDRLVPLPSRGVVTETPGAAKGLRRWSVELGGAGRVGLRIVPASSAETRRRLTLLRQSNTYELSPQAVQLSAQWTLDVHDEPLGRLQLALEPELRLVMARLGDREIPWSVTTDGESGISSVVLQLPELLEGTGRVLQLQAIAPLETDRPWRLPRISSEGLFWAEGQTRLLVPAPLIVEQLTPIDCRQTRAESLPAPQSGELVELQDFSAGAALEVLVSRREGLLEQRQGTTIDYTAAELAGRMVVEFRISQGQRFALAGAVPDGWIIDSIESEPTGAIADWNLEANRQLTIQLAKALTASSPLRIAVVGRSRRAAADEPLSVADCRLVDFPDAQATLSLMLIRAAQAFQLTTSGDEALARLKVEDLAPADAELLAGASQGLLFAVNEGANPLRVAFRAESPGLAAEVHVAATVRGESAQSLEESYTIRCLPEGAPIERLRVHFSAARPAPLRWSLAEDSDEQLTARRVNDNESALSDSVAGGETWEIALKRPRSAPFTILAGRVTPLIEPVAIGLAALPEAPTQSGIVQLRSASAREFIIRQNRLATVADAEANPRRYSPGRGTYLFEAARDVLTPATPALVVAPAGDASRQPLAWVWRLQVDARIGPNHVISHVAAFRLQNAGRDVVRVTLPEGAHASALFVDGAPLPRADLDSSNAAVTIPLPANVKYPTIVLHFESHSDSGLLAQKIDPVLPEIDVPISSTQWTLWLPPGLVAEPSADFASIAGESVAPVDWSVRLFGPLVRSGNEPTSNPLSLKNATRSGADSSSLENPDNAGPWSVALGVPSEFDGWSAVRARSLGSGDAGEIVPVRVVDFRARQFLACVLFLAACAASCWLLLDRPMLWCVAVGVSGLVALVLPAAYAPLATGVFLGTLASVLALVARPAELPAPPSAIRADFKLPREALAALGLALTAALFTSNAGAQPPLDPLPAKEHKEQATPATTKALADDKLNGDAERPIFQVFVPTSADAPGGDGEYLIPERLRTLLQRRAAAADHLPTGWLLTGAKYHGRLNNQGSPPRAALTELRATYEFRTFQRNAAVQIPLDQKEVTLLAEGARLNTRRVTATWNDEVTALVVLVAEPGDYELTLALGPPDPTQPAPGGMEFGIPRLATSRVVVEAPLRAAELSLASARGASRVERNEAQGLVSYEADVGPASRLTIGLPEGDADASIAKIEGDELLWLRVQPGAVELFVRLKIKVLEGRLSQVRLAADPRLRLMPLGDDSPVAIARSEQGPLQTIFLDLRRPVSDQITIDARLLLTGASGVGNLRLPYLKVLQLPSSKRYLAVSLDEALEAGQRTGELLEPLGEPEFLAAWGEATEPPRMAFKLPVQNVAWSLATRPRPSTTTGSETLTFSVGRDDVAVRYEADLDTVAGFSFQYKIAVPEALLVESIAVREAGIDRAARWAQSQAAAAGQGTEVTVFLTGPLTGKHRLTLAGRLKREGDTPLALPQLTLKTGETKSGVLRIYRRPEAIVKFTPGTGLELQAADTTDGRSGELGRLVASYQYARGQAEGTLAISANVPAISPSSALVTRLAADGETWTAEADLRLRVHKGLLDAVRLETPASWTGPFEIEPKIDMTLTEPDERGRRQLVITPPAAIADDFRLRIRGPLRVAGGDRVRVPAIVPLGISPVERYLMLPVQAGAQRMAWDVRGLKLAERPTYLPAHPEGLNLEETYKVIADQFEAQSTSAGRASQMAQVRLADIRAALDEQGAVRGVATFDLAPGLLADCRLELPANHRLLQVTVGGLRAVAEPVDDRHWSIAVATQTLPQRIEVVYAGQIPPPTTAEVTLHAPVLLSGMLQVHVASTLWTVRGPAAWQSGRPERGDSLAADAQALVRLQSTADLLTEVELPLLAEPSPTWIEAWYTPWTRRIHAGRAAVEKLQTSDTQNATERRIHAIRIYSEQQLVADALGLRPVFDAAATEFGTTAPVMLDDAGDVWDALAGKTEPVRSQSQGAASSFTVKYVSPAGHELSSRFGAAMLLVLACVGVSAAARRPEWREFASRWPAVGGLFLGVAWWLWFWPSIVGWLIVLVSLAALLARAHGPVADSV